MPVPLLMEDMQLEIRNGASNAGKQEASPPPPPEEETAELPLKKVPPSIDKRMQFWKKWVINSLNLNVRYYYFGILPVVLF